MKRIFSSIATKNFRVFIYQNITTAQFRRRGKRCAYGFPPRVRNGIAKLRLNFEIQVIRSVLLRRFGNLCRRSVKLADVVEFD